MENSITDVEGIRVGHAADYEGQTGCTVVLSEEGFVGSCEVRGGAPGTRETALLQPTAMMNQVHGILLTGGSAFGLEAAGGVMKFLAEKGVGYDTGIKKVPIVPAGVIFDLVTGQASAYPDAEMAYQACQQAKDTEISSGNHGVAVGATVGKIRGMGDSMSTEIGTVSIKKGDLVVGALAVCNAFGDIVAPGSGKVLAGARNDDGSFADSTKLFMEQTVGLSGDSTQEFENTTLVVVATNAEIDKTAGKKLAEMAHDGLARSISPVHTMLDGDLVFTLGKREGLKVDLSVLGTIVAETVCRAVLDCVPDSK